MKCSRANKKLSAFLDGELPEDKRILVLEHLKACESCQRAIEELTLVSDSLDALGAETAPPFFAARVRRRVAEAEERRSFPLLFIERVKRAAVPAVAVALLCVSVLAGGVLGRGIYELRAQKATKEEAEIVDLLGVGSFNGFTDGSLVVAYADIMSGEGE